ncbi:MULTISPECIES: SDR family NAD(P)-dependent oxidoreductase [unclassified Streptomyces]|uniref:SDR family NAD(P)-dependent oxidoreductase n=1 Tax=unclassified Streptomyces TaxID=2593676 RepID=UPI0011CE1B78|nr:MULTISPECIES: SDR family NAD(P)-dependent oxidoreductase [unclassified Streptomyces]TXS68643.1 SDR family oxidoreductase [Streptomyces sp. me109]
MEFSGRTALVTGATAGIGRAVAAQLAREGADVVVHGRDTARGDEVVTEITAAGGTARFVQADLGDPRDAQRLTEEAGDVDVLVNNAGVYRFHSTPEMTTDLFDLQMNLNTRAPYLLVRELAPRMAARGHGSIVNISSVAATLATTGTGIYAASKAALEQLTRIWATEYAREGVRVNTVAPGPIRTPGMAEHEAMLKAVADGMTAMGRVGEPEEVAEAVTFLASDRAGYITGALLEVGGGRPALI